MPRGDSPGRSGCTSAFLLPRGAQLCTSHFSYGVERGRGARGRRLLPRRRPELVRFRALAHASTPAVFVTRLLCARLLPGPRDVDVSLRPRSGPGGSAW